MHFRRYILLLVSTALLILAISTFMSTAALADSGDDSQVHTVSTFVPLGGSQAVNNPYDSGNPNYGYSPYSADNPDNNYYNSNNPGDNYSLYSGANNNSPQSYWNPYNPNSPFNYGSPNYGNPYPTDTSASIDPDSAPQQDTGHHYGGNGLPFSGYSNSGTSPLHMQQ